MTAAAAALLLAAVVAPRGLTAVSVVIEANGARSESVSGEETAADCRRFRLSPAAVRTFFTRARRVDARAFHHDLSMSRCHARGRLRLPDGRAGAWFIDRERRGSFQTPGEPPAYFVCLTCTSRRFDGLDAEDREAARAMIAAFAGDPGGWRTEPAAPLPVGPL